MGDLLSTVFFSHQIITTSIVKRHVGSQIDGPNRPIFGHKLNELANINWFSKVFPV
jgi:hypothetical protein